MDDFELGVLNFLRSREITDESALPEAFTGSRSEWFCDIELCVDVLECSGAISPNVQRALAEYRFAHDNRFESRILSGAYSDTDVSEAYEFLDVLIGSLSS